MRILLKEMTAFDAVTTQEVAADTLVSALDVAFEQGAEKYRPQIGQWSTEVIWSARELDEHGKRTGKIEFCQGVFHPNEPSCIDDSGHAWELVSARKDDDREIREDRCSRCHVTRKIDTYRRSIMVFAEPYTAIRYTQTKDKP